jgi:diguanylate cyclase (GGDEF)-like protein
MRRNVRTPERLAVLFADLDQFKAVNDDYGHEAGDELLRASARRLRQWLRGSDHLARYGGDEFVIVLEGDDARTDAVKVAERLEHEMSRPFALICGSVTIGSSVGIAFVEATDTIALVLAKADSAMYQRKTERRGGSPVPPARPLSRLG